MKSKDLNVLLIGSGGREHAIFSSIENSPLAKNIYVFPGNAGFPSSVLLSKEAISLEDKIAFQKSIQSLKIDLVIVGPEDPLVKGLADWCKEVQIPCFGPSAYCANLEGSKDFAKAIMKKAGVPTASYQTFTNFEESANYINNHKTPLVIKADGLAAGKGVLVTSNLSEAIQFLEDIFKNKKFGSSGSKVVIESFLEGEEASVFAISDGYHYVLLPPAQDHKRAYDQDKGPNTGGMGAYAPAPIVTESVIEKTKTRILNPMFEILRKEGFPYVGVLYAGLMIDKHGDPYVVEFNCRLGDPETQVVLPLVDEDLLSRFNQAANGQLNPNDLLWKEAFSAVVVLAAEGYPDSNYQKDIPISFNSEEKSGVRIFHAGTKRTEQAIVSSGGRILGVASWSESLKGALVKIYDFLDSNPIPRTFYRKDIGHRAL